MFDGRVSARSGALMSLLGEVDTATEAERGVMIASLVVRADTGMPGEGYFAFAADELGREAVGDPRAFWEREVQRVWDAYAPAARRPTVSRAEALAHLRGEHRGLVTGVSWMPGELLEAAWGRGGLDAVAEEFAGAVTDLGLDFAFVPADEPWATRAVALLAGADVAALWATSGVLGRLADRLGWLEALRLTAAEPGALAAPLSEALHAALDSARAGLAAGADAVVVADDLAGASGPLVSPDFALDALLPCYRSIAAELAESDTPAIFHSDGDIRVLLPALARAGFSAIHVGSLATEPFEATLVTAGAVGMTVLGGIEAARLPEDAEQAGAAAGGMGSDRGTRRV